MIKKRLESEQGQSIVLVAILIVVLLTFAALAIDFGRIYLERRFLQNAADAGALAAARAMCFDGLTYEEAIAPGGPAEKFAKQNVPNPVDTVVEFPEPPNAWTVVVTARENALPTFMSAVVDMNTVTVGATAAAACGPTETVCGLWPVAFPALEYDQLEGDPCTERVFYVWNGDNDEHGGGGKLSCDVFECDLPDANGIKDGINEIIDGEGRAWLDFSEVVIEDPRYPDNNCSQSGCGAAELACFIRKSGPAQISLPRCIGGDFGTRVSEKKPVEDRIDDPVSLPLYDAAGCPGPTNCKDTFNIIALGCIKPKAWEHLDVAYKDKSHKPPTRKFQLIKAQIDCTPGDCNTSCGTIPSGPCPAGTVCAVSLIE